MSDILFTAPPASPAAGPLMDSEAIARTLHRMACEIIERNAEQGLDRLAIVGIYTRGVEIARRLVALIQQLEKVSPVVGTLEISVHRDDFGQRVGVSSLRTTELPLDLDRRTVVLVDDVFFTGRTARAALDALSEYGRPARIQLAVLIDRGHRELPIRPDFVGKFLSTARPQRVSVRLQASDGAADSVWLVGEADPDKSTVPTTV